MLTIEIEAAYREHTPALLRYARRLTGEPDQAEEVVAETWTKAVAAWARFQQVPGASARDWLYAIARNCCRDRWRHNRHILWEQLPEDDADAAPIVPADTEAQAIARERLTLAAEALRQVRPASQRNALRLAWAGYGPHDAARTLGVTESGAKALYYRSRNSFRAAYAAAGGY